MGERILVQGNEAVGWGALQAGCEAFFGYPITPQNEVTEWFAREFPRRGKVFLQCPSEVSAINMLYGAGATGVRAMTSTSGPGWSLMQETMSHLAAAQIPCVVVLVQRGGVPGEANVRHGQAEYLSATRGGGHGGYKTLVLNPTSVQEIHDLIQLAFHLADKYRNPAVVLTDAVIAEMAEPLEVKALDFASLPEKDWAIIGKGKRADKKRRIIVYGPGVTSLDPPFENFKKVGEYYQRMWEEMKKETRYEEYLVEDAEIILVSSGYCARACKEAVNRARKKGIKAGILRPITLWPFPYQPLKERAEKGAKFIVVEDNLGQMVEDVKLGVEGKAPVSLVSLLDRHLPSIAGFIMPESILEKIEKVAGEES